MAKIELCDHGILRQLCSECNPKPKRAEEKQMYSSVVLRDGGGVVNIPQPAEFNFPAWMKVVKADGGVFLPDMHVPYDNIAFVYITDDPLRPLPATRHRNDTLQ